MFNILNCNQSQDVVLVFVVCRETCSGDLTEQQNLSSEINDQNVSNWIEIVTR